MCGPSLKDNSDKLYDGTLNNEYVSEIFPNLYFLMKIIKGMGIVIMCDFAFYIISK